jgi:hypothetical protein
LLGFALAGPPADAAEPAGSTAAAPSPAFMKYAWMWSGKDADAPARRYVPVAACTMDCCCEFFQGGERKSQCKSHDDCLNAGGICRSKSDAKCN